jgi:hypothetical protein
MGISTLVIGQSGRGKSTSIANLDPATTMVVKVINKPFPFRSKDWKRWDKDSQTGSYEVTDNYEIIKAIIKGAKSKGKKVIVIDDMQYLMANEFMKRSSERGFDKFTEIAEHIWSLVMVANEATDDDMRIYFLSHTEQNDIGETKAKTIGKLLDDKITLEGMFTIVLGAGKDGDEFFFSTQNNGRDTCKSPKGMFAEDRVANDLKLVDDAIVEYYGLDL